MILDLVIVLVLVLFCVRSFRGGLQGELLGVVGWLLAILVAISSNTMIGDAIASRVPQLAAISYLVAFALVLIGIRFAIGAMVKAFPESSKGAMPVVSRILAVAAGFFKGAFFISVFLLLLSQSSMQAKLEKQIGESTLYHPLADFSRQVVRIIVDKVPNVKNILDKTAINKEKNAAE